jgi:SPASM domain peptide maturase of grasp-with-spasm system
MDKEYFTLFANCYPVKGVVRSGICDVQLGKFQTIPNSLYDLLEELTLNSLSAVLNKYDAEDQVKIRENLDWIAELGFGFWCNSKTELERFIPISEEFQMPYDISNIIIDLNENSSFDLENLISQIKDIGIPYLQIRSYSYRSIEFYISIANQFNSSRVKGLDIITPYFDSVQNYEFPAIFRENLRINQIVFWGSPNNQVINEIANQSKVIYTTQNLTSSKCCGIIYPELFEINKELFLESKKYNSCLNKKIGIDTNGEIKNCPSMSNSFGNINNTKLKTVVSNSDFTKIWQIKKDEILICKSCEFRYICSDCRAFVEDPNNINSKPLKCGYDPRTAKWEDWATSPLKQKAMSFYNI